MVLVLLVQPWSGQCCPPNTPYTIKISGMAPLQSLTDLLQQIISYPGLYTQTQTTYLHHMDNYSKEPIFNIHNYSDKYYSSTTLEINWSQSSQHQWISSQSSSNIMQFFSKVKYDPEQKNSIYTSQRQHWVFNKKYTVSK